MFIWTRGCTGCKPLAVLMKRTESCSDIYYLLANSMTLPLIIMYSKFVWPNLLQYTRKFLQYEIFAEQEANRIFTIIFLRITGSSRKGSTCYVLLQISNCCKLANFHGLNFCCIRRWLWYFRNLHTAEISVHTVIWPDNGLENDWWLAVIINPA